MFHRKQYSFWFPALFNIQYHSHCCSNTSLNLSKLHYSLKGKDMWNTLFFIYLLNRNRDIIKVIKQSLPDKEDRDWPKSTGSKQSLEKSQQWLRSQLWRVSDLYFLFWDNACFFGEQLCGFIFGLLRTEALYFEKSHVQWDWHQTVWQQILVFSEQPWLLIFLRECIRVLHFFPPVNFQDYSETVD